MSRLYGDAPGGAQSVAKKEGGAPLSFMVEAEDGPVRLQYFAPPEHLRPYFGSFYLFSETLDSYSDVTRADVPQLRLMLQGGGTYHFHDGTAAPTPEVCLLGPTLGATCFHLDGPSQVAGMSLLPAGWLSIHGGDASMQADRLGGVSGEKGRVFEDLLHRLRGMDDSQAMAALCWSVLEDLVNPLSDSTWRLLEAVDGWLMGEGSPRIETLAQRTGLSPRQLARLTNRHYGCPPKLLARKYRALRCSARIALDGHSWQDLCEDGRFYDQSHFIREIKHFIGLTPHQLQTEPTAVAQLTLLRRSLGGDVAVLNRLS
ncbi:helix-turn-helix domain-containing protein [Sphingobium vermicomposti]|uniref:AraC-like DNA-binding protein n=1 Tax=Sphingobium vermicomposti TaxID=529005 RepID=A0A846M5G1_9SPHN|nr:AraC family transcriptional regulator [Sphingobium vermicomposti]NIJ15841.1 AraC-like DNA-binding protein [Sphingobium vermicomposti]